MASLRINHAPRERFPAGPFRVDKKLSMQCRGRSTVPVAWAKRADVLAPSSVDQLDVEAAILHGLDAIGDLDQLAGGGRAIGISALYLHCCDGCGSRPASPKYSPMSIGASVSARPSATRASSGHAGVPDVTERITDRLKTFKVFIGDPYAERILCGDRHINQRKRVDSEIFPEAMILGNRGPVHAGNLFEDFDECRFDVVLVHSLSFSWHFVSVTVLNLLSPAAELGQTGHLVCLGNGAQRIELMDPAEVFREPGYSSIAFRQSGAVGQME